MKVFYDSNVVLDVLLNRTDFVSDSLSALKLSENRIVKGYISVVSITDIFYLVKKNLKDTDAAIEKIKTLLKIVSVAKADEKIAKKAIDSGWKDFEDSVQYSVAKKANCKCIVTRNKKDYKFSDIPVYTPTEFIELY